MFPEVSEFPREQDGTAVYRPIGEAPISNVRRTGQTPLSVSGRSTGGSTSVDQPGDSAKSEEFPEAALHRKRN